MVAAPKKPEVVQHTNVSVDGKIIWQMSDGVEDAVHSGFSVSLGVQTVKEAKIRFDNLATEGVVIVALAVIEVISKLRAVNDMAQP
jgi:uncharacterized glyoxalase superfamily protein PhnB